MLNIDTKAYVLRMFLELFFFYLAFFNFYKKVSLKKQAVIITLFVPLTFFAQIFLSSLADIIPILGCYFFLKQPKKSDFVLLSTSLLSMITTYLVSIFVSAVVLPFTSFDEIKGFLYIITEVSLKMVALLVIIFLYRQFRINQTVEKYGSFFSTLLLSYFFLALLLFLYASHYYQAFDKFIIGITVFVTIQVIFLALIFIKEITNQKEQYEQQLSRQQLTDLKKYTDQLERNQQNLRKFKHDYKNIILSLRERAIESRNEELERCIDDLDEYSENNLYSSNWNYNDVQKIKNTYLKSLFVSKLFVIQEQNINCHFECNNNIDTIPIHTFDLIRILGITLDNAIEEASLVNDGIISILIYEDDTQIEFLIENTCKPNNTSVSQLVEEGFSSKKNHLGLGLSNIQEIKQKYSNIYVQYRKEEDMFSVQFILVFEQSDYHRLSVKSF